VSILYAVHLKPESVQLKVKKMKLIIIFALLNLCASKNIKMDQFENFINYFRDCSFQLISWENKIENILCLVLLKLSADEVN